MSVSLMKWTCMDVHTSQCPEKKWWLNSMSNDIFQIAFKNATQIGKVGVQMRERSWQKEDGSQGRKILPRKFNFFFWLFLFKGSPQGSSHSSLPGSLTHPCPLNSCHHLLFLHPYTFSWIFIFSSCLVVPYQAFSCQCLIFVPPLTKPS